MENNKNTKESSKGSKRDTPPAGEYVTDAQSTKDPIDIGGTTGEGSFADTVFGANPKGTVLARDIYTGRVLKLSGIKIRVTPNTAISGFAQDQRYKLHCESYEAFKKMEVNKMFLIPAGTTPVVQNNALPQPVRVKDTLGSFGETPSTICRKFNQNVEEAKKRLGMLYDRQDLKILQGSKDGRSPGVAVNQHSGNIYMFDNTGKQSISMDGKRIKMVANAVDTGGSEESRKFFGFPAKKNPVNDTTPQGTIITPQPRLIPDVTTFANIIMTIMDMVDLVQACSEAVQTVESAAKGNPFALSQKEKLLDKSRMSDWERRTEEEKRKQTKR